MEAQAASRYERLVFEDAGLAKSTAVYIVDRQNIPDNLRRGDTSSDTSWYTYKAVDTSYIIRVMQTSRVSRKLHVYSTERYRCESYDCAYIHNITSTAWHTVTPYVLAGEAVCLCFVAI